MSSSSSTPQADRRPILIAGPTASGKSALAVGLAERLGGWVINADALQVYDGSRVLTARPSASEEARAPHRLYGHVPMETAHSVGDWLREVASVLAEARAAGARPVIVGGTGLYFRALTEGLAEIPPPAPATRAEGERLLATQGREGLLADLAAHDPETLARLDTANPARVLRAWETWAETGRGLAAWHRDTPPPVLPLTSAVALKLAPPREALYARIDARVLAMVESGALEEVAAVAARRLPASAPALKAVGAREFLDHRAGRLTLDDAIARCQRATRHYAKRQMTWARNQMGAWRALTEPDHDTALAVVAEHGG
jgi:tRNA dimethylallyltransferase